MALVASGLMNKQIAGEIGVREVTVKVHRRNIIKNLMTTREPPRRLARCLCSFLTGHAATRLIVEFRIKITPQTSIVRLAQTHSRSASHVRSPRASTRGIGCPPLPALARGTQIPIAFRVA
jgi:hypothetical protein